VFAKIKRSLTKKDGFTLIELVVVVVILGILAVALVPGVVGRVQAAKVSRYQSDLDAIATAARMYYVDNSEWPENIGALASYGIDTVKDPWNGDYSVTPSEGNLVIDGDGDEAAATPRTITAPIS